MWLIGMVVCAALMLAGHAVRNGGHGPRGHEPAAAAQPAPTPAERGAVAEGAPESAPRPASGSRH